MSASPSESQPADGPSGTLVDGRYRVVRRIGQGGMGTVYEAVHEGIGRRVAMKCLHPHLASDEALVARFQREARAATLAGNPHIVEVIDIGRLPTGAPYLVLELLEGPDLGSALKADGPLSVRRAVNIVIQACDGLASVHEAGIVHRDLKPPNILLIRKGEEPEYVKLVDFGISKIVEGGAVDTTAARDSPAITTTGTAIGSPSYMAPEQVRAERDIDARTDIYALGVILYELLTGRVPFDAPVYALLMVNILTEDPPPMGAIRADIPVELERVVRRAMSRDRVERFGSARELAAALEPFTANSETPRFVTRPPAAKSVSMGPTAKHARPAPVRSRAIRIAVAASIVVAAGVLAAIVVPPWLARPPARQPARVVSNEPAPRRAPPEPAGQIAAAQPAMAAAAPEVRVRARALPAGARIFLGDVEFPNPMDAPQPRSLVPVRIRVEKDGYQTVEQLVILDADRELDYELRRGRGVRRLRSRNHARAEEAVESTAAPATPPPEGGRQLPGWDDLR